MKNNKRVHQTIILNVTFLIVMCVCVYVIIIIIIIIMGNSFSCWTLCQMASSAADTRDYSLTAKIIQIKFRINNIKSKMTLLI